MSKNVAKTTYDIFENFGRKTKTSASLESKNVPSTWSFASARDKTENHTVTKFTYKKNSQGKATHSSTTVTLPTKIASIRDGHPSRTPGVGNVKNVYLLYIPVDYYTDIYKKHETAFKKVFRLTTKQFEKGLIDRAIQIEGMEGYHLPIRMGSDVIYLRRVIKAYGLDFGKAFRIVFRETKDEAYEREDEMAKLPDTFNSINKEIIENFSLHGTIVNSGNNPEGKIVKAPANIGVPGWEENTYYAQAFLNEVGEKKTTTGPVILWAAGTSEGVDLTNFLNVAKIIPTLPSEKILTFSGAGKQQSVASAKAISSITGLGTLLDTNLRKVKEETKKDDEDNIIYKVIALSLVKDKNGKLTKPAVSLLNPDSATKKGSPYVAVPAITIQGPSGTINIPKDRLYIYAYKKELSHGTKKGDIPKIDATYDKETVNSLIDDLIKITVGSETKKEALKKSLISEVARRVDQANTDYEKRRKTLNKKKAEPAGKKEIDAFLGKGSEYEQEEVEDAELPSDVEHEFSGEESD